MNKSIFLCTANTAKAPDNKNKLYSLGLEYLRATAHSIGWECVCHDAYFHDIDIDTTANLINKYDPRVIGFMVNSKEMLEYAELVFKKTSKKEDRVIIVGGVYVTSKPLEVAKLPFINFAVAGEGEGALRQILCNIDNVNKIKHKNIVKKDISEFFPAQLTRINNLDDLPPFLNDWWSSQLDVSQPTLCTSRGCTGSCSYCIIGPHWGKQRQWRGHSAEWVYEKVSILIEKTKCKSINFVDDEFVGNNASIARAHQFVDLISAGDLNFHFQFMCRPDAITKDTKLFERLRGVGLDRVFLGIETGNPVALERWGKRCTPEQSQNSVKLLNDLKIHVCSGTIFFHPHSTIQSLQKDLDYFEKMLIEFEMFEFNGIYSLDILQGTREAKKQTRYANKAEFKDKQINSAHKLWTFFQINYLYRYLSIIGNDEFQKNKKELCQLQIQTLRDITCGVITNKKNEYIIDVVTNNFIKYAVKRSGSQIFFSLYKSKINVNSIENIYTEKCFA